MIGHVMTGSGGTGRRGRRRLSAAERVERNARIAAAREAGRSWPEICSAFALSDRQARRAAEEHYESARRSAPPLTDLDGAALVARVIDAQATALGLAVALAASAANENARIGALRTVATVATSLHTAMIRSGVVGDAGLERFRTLIRGAYEVVYDLAGRHGISDDEVLAAWERLPAPAARMDVVP